MTSCRGVSSFMRWMMYWRTFSSRSARAELPKNHFLRSGSRVGSSSLGTWTLLSSVFRVWWLLRSERTERRTLLQPEHAQRGWVLTRDEQQTEGDPRGAEGLAFLTVRERPS